MDNDSQNSRRNFLKTAGIVALSTGVGVAAGSSISNASAKSETTKDSKKARSKKDSGGPYNILMIVTDQERYIDPKDLPAGYELEGHRRLAEEGVVFQNHQIASNVCTPSRAVIYTGLHIQHNGMFDNTNLPWGGSLSKEIDTLGDLLRKEDYYTAYKGKWHLTEEFETINKLHEPKEILSGKMEEYGFSDYLGIGDIIGHTQGGYLHDEVISATAQSWLKGRGQILNNDNKPWFLSVNLVNPHDIMYFNTDGDNDDEQTKQAMMHIEKAPKSQHYQKTWDTKLPTSRKQPLDATGRPTAHTDFLNVNGIMTGTIPNEDARWKRQNDYYLNCLKDVDNNVVDILNQLEDLEMMDNTIVIFTSDHGELGGAHGLAGKGATAYQEQNNVPFMMVHPAYSGGKVCKAVTSHVDIATTLISLAGGDPTANKSLPGKDISSLLKEPEKASYNAIREGSLYNFNMLTFVDDGLFNNIVKFLGSGGKPQDMAKQGFKPNLKKRGAIRSIFDGQYKLSRYYSPLEHHVPTTVDELFLHNDVELYDIINDPIEVNNLALNRSKYDVIIEGMNKKLNALIKEEVGDDLGQMLPKIENTSWTLTTPISELRL